LFARKEINGLDETFPVLNRVPLIYYMELFGDAWVPFYLFASDYGSRKEYYANSKEKFPPDPKITDEFLNHIVDVYE
jgi:hypothetical protein